jgi:hypothetical protein
MSGSRISSLSFLFLCSVVKPYNFIALDFVGFCDPQNCATSIFFSSVQVFGETYQIMNGSYKILQADNEKFPTLDVLKVFFSVSGCFSWPHS